jgi:hypothetical protein
VLITDLHMPNPGDGFAVVTGPSFCTKRCESLHHSFGL